MGSGLNDWQPIETAPKDGTRVLLWCTVNRGVYAGFYTTGARRRRGFWEDGEYKLAPSHWQPSPPPPEGAECD